MVEKAYEVMRKWAGMEQDSSELMLLARGQEVGQITSPGLFNNYMVRTEDETVVAGIKDDPNLRDLEKGQFVIVECRYVGSGYQKVIVKALTKRHIDLLKKHVQWPSTFDTSSMDKMIYEQYKILIKDSFDRDMKKLEKEDKKREMINIKKEKTQKKAATKKTLVVKYTGPAVFLSDECDPSTPSTSAPVPTKSANSHSCQPAYQLPDDDDDIEESSKTIVYGELTPWEDIVTSPSEGKRNKKPTVREKTPSKGRRNKKPLVKQNENRMKTIEEIWRERNVLASGSLPDKDEITCVPWEDLKKQYEKQYEIIFKNLTMKNKRRKKK